ncbi:molybdenum cofactor guanylyltransferase [Paraflavitalea soli]|uniref:Molybdenum cofactor guanylyltransferase n=1 Tax=Paraflavitalea soli TaxID=2315862 RepID=A0A3B7MS30_9BACT|nr:molybdenum cofactor guanylyltransferase [Paraflavitalea soli]AXY73321.1 molybdenum cofactor guanylyltransferase [Paraflavitalea soli]
MLGVVLAGGESSRMGTDKGLIRLETKTWAQIALDKLAVFQIPVVISVNAKQHAEYQAQFRVEQLLKDNEGLAIRGPLAGLLSVHRRFPKQDLFVLACDMLLMENSMMEKLVAAYKSSQEDVYLFTNHGEPEPLCAIYTARALADTLDRYHSSKLTKHSIKFMLSHLAVSSIPLQPGQEKYFRNFNSPGELSGL